MDNTFRKSFIEMILEKPSCIQYVCLKDFNSKDEPLECKKGLIYYGYTNDNKEDKGQIMIIDAKNYTFDTIEEKVFNKHFKIQ